MHTKLFISKHQVVNTLKKKMLIPQETPEDIYLPPDPEGRLIFVSQYKKNKLFFSIFENFFKKKELSMNYMQMTEAVREGAHARRPTWKPGEKLWSDGKILIHNTPYFGEPFNQAIQGYPYVCEQVDVFATDWELCATF